MFEDKTYEKLLETKMKNIPSDVDKREGSIVYDAVAGELTRNSSDVYNYW